MDTRPIPGLLAPPSTPYRRPDEYAYGTAEARSSHLPFLWVTQPAGAGCLLDGTVSFSRAPGGCGGGEGLTAAAPGVDQAWVQTDGAVKSVVLW